MTALGMGWAALQAELFQAKHARNELHKALEDVLTILERLAIAGIVKREHLTPQEQHAVSMATYVHEDTA